MDRCCRCLRCKKIKKCKPSNPEVPIKFIRTDNPEVGLPDDTEKEKPSINNRYHAEEMLCPMGKNLPDIDMHMGETTMFSPELEPVYTCKYKITAPLSPRSPQKRRRYRMSIEKWRPAKGLIYCPNCGANKKPIIKSRSEKLSYSTVGTVCILTCWPFCFLPCIFQGPSRDYLHCAECHNFLGMYNKKRNCVRPNRNFVEENQGHQKQMFENPFKTDRHHAEFKVCSESKRV